MPVPPTEVLEVEWSSAFRSEYEWTVEPRRRSIERLERGSRERNLTPRAERLRTSDRQDAPRRVDVATLDVCPLRRPQPCSGCEADDRNPERVEFLADPGQFDLAVGADRPRWRL